MTDIIAGGFLLVTIVTWFMMLHVAVKAIRDWEWNSDAQFVAGLFVLYSATVAGVIGL